MEVPTLDLDQEFKSIEDEINASLEDVLSSKQFVLGEATEDFENQFADFCDVDHAVGVNSGTAALRLLFEALGFEPGDEVITTPMTFIATVEPLMHMDVRPVFVDINPRTYNIDPASLSQAVTDDTVAVVGVDLYGLPVDADPIEEFCNTHDLYFLEDAAQAQGARYNDRQAGSLGKAGTFSFYPGKNLGAYGEAGAVTTDDPDLADRVRKLRDHGRSSKYEHQYPGFNERMHGFQGAVLKEKLKHLDDWNTKRREAADRYDDLLSDLPVDLPEVPDDRETVYHQYVIRSEKRDEVVESLQEADIGAGIHYPIPLHLQPALEEFGYSTGDFPVAERLADQVLSLPVFPQITVEQQAYVRDVLEDALGQYSVSSPPG